MHPFSLESCDHENSCNFDNLSRSSNFSGWNLCRRSIYLLCLRTGTTTFSDAAVCSSDIASPEALTKRRNASWNIPGAFGRGEERAESVPAGNVIAVRDGEGVAGLSDRGWKSCTTVVCIGYGNRCIRTNRAGRSGRTLRLASGRRRVMHGAYAGRISGLKDVKYR